MTKTTLGQSSEAVAARALDLLKTKSVLAALPDAELGVLISRARSVRFKKGEPIYRQGDAGDSLLVVLSGRVKAWIITADAREVVLNFIGEGSVAGELAVLDGATRSANVSALEATDGLLIYRRDVLVLLERHPSVMLALIALLAGKVRHLSAQVEQSQLQMAAKAAGGLLRLADAHGKPVADGIRIDLKMSQRDLGAYLGLSRENTNRQLAEFRDADLVRLEEAFVVIIDRDGLADVAESAL